ncbi:hypothetical protein KI387_011138, partial [Taxus chinensis]
EFCKKEGITCSTQQNDVVARQNMTAMEMAHCIVNSQNVPYQYWAEAVNSTLYVLNQ